MRPWDVQDRLLETGVLEDWREREAAGQESLPVDIELWYRDGAAGRSAATDRVTGLVSALGGQVLTTTVIEGIAYHGILAELPSASVRRVLERPDVGLVRCEQVQFFRATGQMAVPLAAGDRDVDADSPAPVEPLTTAPIARPSGRTADRKAPKAGRSHGRRRP